ncbi:DinB family protein [Chitinophaga filiformis]|uniref:DinB family protein n=1 Tax=Chitinophaga filiformis TaxID=104663 RepID=A0A1G7N0C5_CHIFI|nr:DinB family protein [Chitinophaga filiformis]SDF67366.1 DinB family protein [Chitinophaga filiformis]
MVKVYRQGAKGALLDEYEKAITELQNLIADISDKDLVTIIDTVTTDENCRSIQTILSHVVSSAYSYAIYIMHYYGYQMVRPEKTFHTTVKDYVRDLTEAFQFTETVFRDIKDSELEQLEQEKKIAARWGQSYDIEQMMEHAIVHILRHRRQIERYHSPSIPNTINKT